MTQLRHEGGLCSRVVWVAAGAGATMDKKRGHAARVAVCAPVQRVTVRHRQRLLRVRRCRRVQVTQGRDGSCRPCVWEH